MTSPDITALAKAFLEAKKNMNGVRKNAKSNLHKYANVTAVYDAVEDALFEQGIIIWHMAEYLSAEETILHTRLVHTETGQYIQDTRPLRCEKPGNQALGSANTYMRRYAVLSLCALGDEDDDGEEERKHIENKPAAPSFIYPNQVKEIEQLLLSYPSRDVMTKVVKEIYELLNISRLADIPYNRYFEVKKILESKKA